MTNRDLIIQILQDNIGQVVSGEEIAKKLGITRNAVWKNIISLQEMGYKIENKQGKGYILKEDNDVLSEIGIRKYLSDKNIDIIILDRVDSTNDYIKKYIDEIQDKWLIVFANEQTNGKGRLGRSFYSPRNTGLYFSVLLKPDFGFEYSTFLTTACAVAVCSGIKKVFPNLEPKIKWVNDVYIDDKKVCGILTEGQINIETQTFAYAIVGVGVNIYVPSDDFPQDIKNIATSLSNSEFGDGKNLLASTIIDEYKKLYLTIGKNDTISKKYRELSCVIGKDIIAIRGDEKKEYTAIGIDDKCRLIVSNNKGENDILSSGEISIRIK